MKRLAYAAAMAFIMLVPPAQAGAQVTVERAGDGDIFFDDRIDRMLRSGRYVPLHDASTTIPAGDTVHSDLLVLGGELFLEGVVLGDLVGIDADLYMRPGSRVERDVVNIGGGLYRSELSETGGRIRSAPNTRYTVRQRDGRVVIQSQEERTHLVLDGAFGFHVPEYNRVDGLAPDWGFTWTADPVAGVTPGVRARLGYRTERGALTGGGSAFVERRGWALEGGWSRDTRSNDRWIRSGFRNSLDFLVDGDDLRNYYEADVLFGELRYRIGEERAPKQVILGVRFQEEDARSLAAGNPWTALGPDTLRENPPIEPGDIRSLIPFVDAEWLTPRTSTQARLEIENGTFDLPGQSLADCMPDADCVAADGSFTRLRLDSEFAMQALLDHTIEIELQFMMPLAGDEPLPRQRWGMMGGSGTLRTVPDASLNGDHLAYSETEYVIPLRRIRLPMNVYPQLELLHMAGLAWTGQREQDFIQNVGVRLMVWALFARWITDPASGESELTFGLTWPFDDSYPWDSE